MLGTARQASTRTRNHLSAFLRLDDLGLLLDGGGGTQRQRLHAGVPASRVHRVCLTHAHGDHCLGLPGARRVVLLHLSRRSPGPAELLAEAGEEHDDVVVAEDLDVGPVPARR